MSTLTAPHAKRQAWLLQQRVIGLRVVGTSIEKELPASFESLRVGSAPDCELCFLHPMVSKRHGTLRLAEDGLSFHESNDPPPKNGSFFEGQRRAWFPIAPGDWFTLGTLDLVAYSHESRQQCGVFARYLGYGEQAHLAIDRTYYAATRDRHIALIGSEGAALPLARAIHELRGETRGMKVPAGHVNQPLQVAPPLTNATSGDQIAVLKAASGRTLVVDARLLPKDPSSFMQMIEARTYENRLLLLVPHGSDAEQLLGPRLRNDVFGIPVPGLGERAAELPRLIQETIAEQSSRLQATGRLLTDDDLDRLHRIRWTEHMEEVESCISKLIACRLYKSTRRAAEALGFKSPGTISTWAKKYKFNIKQ